jgi:hypothetical protein
MTFNLGRERTRLYDHFGSFRKAQRQPHRALAERRIMTELDALQTDVDALKRLQAETAAELDAFPAILDRAFKGEL